MQTFKINIEQEKIDDLKKRLSRTRFSDECQGVGWQDGTSVGFLRRLVDYWSNTYDWRSVEAKLNSFSHFKTDISGHSVHFVHEKARSGEGIPVLLLNGWPSNFAELLPIAERLVQEKDGQAFNVVIPSLLGYGFSERPVARGANFSKMGDLFTKLMTDLGYERFLVAGSDLGAAVGVAIARNHSHRLIGGHWCNVYSGYPAPQNPTPEEQEFLKAAEYWRFTEAGYFMEQATKPTSLAAGLIDSPAGLASWVIEKFYGWGDTNKDIESRFSLNALCTILSIYWFTETIGSSMRLYKEAMSDHLAGMPLPKSDLKHGVFIPGHIDLPAPKAWAERNLGNVIRYNKIAEGGHFPALEVPDQYVNDLQAFAKQLTM